MNDCSFRSYLVVGGNLIFTLLSFNGSGNVLLEQYTQTQKQTLLSVCTQWQVIMKQEEEHSIWYQSKHTLTTLIYSPTSVDFYGKKEEKKTHLFYRTTNDPCYKWFFFLRIYYLFIYFVLFSFSCFLSLISTWLLLLKGWARLIFLTVKTD